MRLRGERILVVIDDLDRPLRIGDGLACKELR